MARVATSVQDRRAETVVLSIRASSSDPRATWARRNDAPGGPPKLRSVREKDRSSGPRSWSELYFWVFPQAIEVLSGL